MLYNDVKLNVVYFKKVSNLSGLNTSRHKTSLFNVIYQNWIYAYKITLFLLKNQAITMNACIFY